MCKTITLIIHLLCCTLSYSQDVKVSKQGFYKRYEDFVNKNLTKVDEPFSIEKFKEGYCYKIRDASGTRLRKPYFAIVQNDSILIRTRDIEEKFKSNRKVFMLTRRFDYNLVLYKNNVEVYLEQSVASKSTKIIGIGLGYSKGVVFNQETAQSYIFMDYQDIESFLLTNNRPNLLEYLPDKKRVNADDIDLVMRRYFQVD